MKKQRSYIQGDKKKSDQFISFLQREIADGKYSNFSICAAYVSCCGVTRVRELLFGIAYIKSRWPIGIDDSISEPDARVAFGMRHSDVPLFGMPLEARFHAKSHLLESPRENRATLIVGSPNLTESSLPRNCETHLCFRADSKEEINNLKSYW